MRLMITSVHYPSSSFFPLSHYPSTRLIRLEQLRLVGKTWLSTIDSTPKFWTCIPNHPKASARMNEWIKKSGDAPFHILSESNSFPQSPEPFIFILCPLFHRWKSVWFGATSGHPSTNPHHSSKTSSWKEYLSDQIRACSWVLCLRSLPLNCFMSQFRETRAFKTPRITPAS